MGQQRYHEELVPLLRRPEQRARADAEFLWGGHPQGPPGHNSGREEGDAGCSELRALGQARRGQVREAVLRSAIGALLPYLATFVMCTVLYLKSQPRQPGSPISRPLFFFCPATTGNLAAVM